MPSASASARWPDKSTSRRQRRASASVRADSASVPEAAAAAAARAAAAPLAGGGCVADAVAPVPRRAACISSLTASRLAPVALIRDSSADASRSSAAASPSTTG